MQFLNTPYHMDDLIQNIKLAGIKNKILRFSNSKKANAFDFITGKEKFQSVSRYTDNVQFNSSAWIFP